MLNLVPGTQILRSVISKDENDMGWSIGSGKEMFISAKGSMSLLHTPAEGCETACVHVFMAISCSKKQVDSFPRVQEIATQFAHVIFYIFIS